MKSSANWAGVDTRFPKKIHSPPAPSIIIIMKREKGTCEKIVSSFDLVGPEVVHFTYDGEKNHKTIFGGFASIIGILVILYYLISHLVYFWTKPYFTVETLASPSSE